MDDWGLFLYIEITISQVVTSPLPTTTFTGGFWYNRGVRIALWVTRPIPSGSPLRGPKQLFGIILMFEFEVRTSSNHLTHQLSTLMGWFLVLTA